MRGKRSIDKYVPQEKDAVICSLPTLPVVTHNQKARIAGKCHGGYLNV